MEEERWDSVLRWPLIIERTEEFSCISIAPSPSSNGGMPSSKNIVLNIDSDYTHAIARAAIQRRPWCKIVEERGEVLIPPASRDPSAATFQLCEFEHIRWEDVMSGKDHASSYVVRKGLSRKAQMALQIRKYVAKHPQSILTRAVPKTLIVETWGAFEDVKFDFGMGGVATFSSGVVLQATLAQRLEWCLDEIREEMAEPARRDWLWILKPSTTNKGANISLVASWEELIYKLEDLPDVREWVLQEYVQRPLKINGYKFHIRVYVLCIGALKVFVNDKMLLLLAAHKYDLSNLEDDHIHLTNTCRSAEDIDFDEVKFVKTIDELPGILRRAPGRFQQEADAEKQVGLIKKDIKEITRSLFEAFENEYTVFSPMSSCFELFGLDFLVDESFQTYLLEANPGPDFKQTGDRLRRLIVDLWENTLQLVLDDGASLNGGSEAMKDNFNFFLDKVYDKEWSVSRMQHSMQMK